jgi:GNAT superfamily N-acetyltransferase
MPPATSPDLVLVTPTPAERLACLKANAASWRGPLTPGQYIRREEILIDQDMTRDGALASWILVDRNLPPDSRTILCSCESYAKRAFLAYNGKTEDIVAHAIGSVYCRSEFRGRGYAKRMMAELAKILDTWQQDKTDRKQCVFSVLYSDIGKDFYAAHGWKPFPASHMSLPTVSWSKGEGQVNVDLSLVKDMDAEDVRNNMCSDAVIDQYRQILRNLSRSDGGKAKVAMAPDYSHMSWHWAREDFYIETLFPEQGYPRVKGAAVPSRGIFVCWTRTFGCSAKDRTLYILRALFDEKEPASLPEKHAAIQGLAAVLRRAQIEAGKWQMDHVEIWNPSPMLQEAAKLLDEQTALVERVSSGIPSLKWAGKELGLGKDVEWVWNERYAWC